MKSKKQISIQEAAAEIKNGDTVLITGFCFWRKPMAIVYEMVRQQKRDLHLPTVNPGIDIDVLVGGGCVKIWESNYVGMELYGKIGNNFARAVKEGSIICEDYSHYHGVLRLQAAAMGLPFLPSFACLGTDLLNPEYDMLGQAGLRDGSNPMIPKEKFKIIKDPFYEDGNIVLVPAARANVCIAHVQKVGDEGTVRIDGQRFADVEAMQAADKLIVMAEEIVPESELRLDPAANVLPGFRVDAIVECRYGGHPGGVYGCYDTDGDFVKEYVERGSKTQEDFDRWADEWIYGVKDHAEYLDKIGAARLLKIRANSVLKWSPSVKRGVR